MEEIIKRIEALEQQLHAVTDLNKAMLRVMPPSGGFEIPPGYRIRDCVIAGKSGGVQLFSKPVIHRAGNRDRTTYERVAEPAPTKGYLVGTYQGLAVERVKNSKGRGQGKEWVLRSDKGQEANFSLFVGAYLGGGLERQFTDRDSNTVRTIYTSIGGCLKKDGSGNAAKSMLAFLANARPDQMDGLLKVHWEQSSSADHDSYMDLTVESVDDSIFSHFQEETRKSIFNPQRNPQAADPLFLPNAIYNAVHKFAIIQYQRMLGKVPFEQVFHNELYRSVSNCFWTYSAFCEFLTGAAQNNMNWPQIIQCLTNLEYSASIPANRGLVNRAIEGASYDEA